MKKASEIIKLYFYYDSLNRSSIKSIINLISTASPVTIEKFSFAEPKFFPINNETYERVVDGLINYPRYSFSWVLLRDQKYKVLIMLNYSCQELFEVTIFFYDDAFLSKNQKKIESFYNSVTNISSCVYAMQDRYDEYLKKNYLIEMNEDGTTEGFVGTKFENGFPGLYHKTYFSKTHCGDFFENKKALLNKYNIECTSLGVNIITSNEQEQNEIITILGKDFFFDLNTPETSKSLPEFLQNRITFLKGQSVTVVPNFNGEKLNQLLLSEMGTVVQNELGFFDVNMKIEDVQKQICFELESKNKQCEDYWIKSIKLGYKLGEYWAKKYNKKWDYTKGIEVESYVKFTINPYYVVARIEDDGLNLVDMEIFMKNKL